MKLLYDDVLIVADTSSPGFFDVIRKGSKDKLVSITEAEAFIAEGMRNPYNEIVLLAKCNSRFSQNLKTHDLQGLVKRLDACGVFEPRASDNNIHIEEKSAASSIDHGEYKSAASSIDHGEYKSAASPMDNSKAKDSLGIDSVIDGEEENGEDSTYSINHLSLFNPQPFLDILLKFFGFLRFFNILVPFLFIFSLVGVLCNLDIFFADIAEIRHHISFFDRILFSLFTINLMTQLYRGVTARYFGFDTPSFGMILVYGLLPRFNIKVIVPEDSLRNSRLWFFGAPIYLRFIVFPLGVILWLATREQGTYLPLIGASLAGVSIISFFFVANPLIGGAAYRFISEYFETPNLRKKAFARLKAFFTRQPPVVTQYIDRSASVLIYGLLSTVFSLIIIVFVVFMIAIRLEANYQGSGVGIFLLLLVYLFFRFAYKPWKRRKIRSRAQKKVASKGNSPPVFRQSLSRKFFGYCKLVIRTVIFCALFCTGFIPYRYESGGQAEVFPLSSAGVFAESSQVLQDVYFDGGETLKKGTVIAELVNERHKYDIERTLKEIQKKQEELNMLLSTPLPEQTAMAKEELNTARLQLRYSQKRMAVYEDLYGKNAIPLVQYQDEQRQLELFKQAVTSAQANLNYINNQVNSHEIEATKIEISILRSQLAFYQLMLDRTLLKMPIDGKIITMHLKNLKNSYLEMGKLFAQVEDTSKVRIEIKIPEGDIGEVAQGNSVVIKLRTFPNRTFRSEIRKIYPSTMESSSGRYVVGDCIVINSGGDLKSGMTGYAKIMGSEMLAFEAFSRALVRFFKIEVWSWIP
ncbi:Putative membrane-associated Zn-dependent proteases 1 [Desulfamplus magnetovallimortis]|uniref:Putative membrane-associated Zn-dependent proteases 1 n=1 Tax=Desulfamplus magnetovallimortis TaxID=1246637 RepID=L0R3T1_9BACT|nr:efflux RND transporter periplasmic adaptor subunit [Desulfamplus magnetovallimortis]CCO06648.1 Putative membrane-associated Zn-dependent proteases 1 [Desulfamplus magnetovallimortis BW-1]SLM32699.1 Putative membrane-associated Zn-dependent proteases 1 [Desulfamplus magnetovallimortis]